MKRSSYHEIFIKTWLYKRLHQGLLEQRAAKTISESIPYAQASHKLLRSFIALNIQMVDRPLLLLECYRECNDSDISQTSRNMLHCVTKSTKDLLKI